MRSLPNTSTHDWQLDVNPRSLILLSITLTTLPCSPVHVVYSCVSGESRQMQGSPLIGRFFDQSECLSDPVMCSAGMSLSMWIKVN